MILNSDRAFYTTSPTLQKRHALSDTRQPPLSLSAMPRLVRRQPLSERIKSFLDPYDFLLWLAEELHDSTWDDALRDWTLPIGAASNLIFVIARANSGGPASSRRNDVFGDMDGRGSSGWFSWLV